MALTLSGARVLVTGASGFLGRRLVERLVLEHGAHVRVLVRRVMGAVPVARLPVEIIVGDILDPRAVTTAVDGCAVVFNCAKGKGADRAVRRAVDVDGPRSLVEAARRCNARLVHVSSMAVYDRPDDGEFDERAPDARKGDLYSDAKLEGERVALREGARHGVPVAVIQPGVIYGPYAANVTETLEELRTTRMVLVNGGTGICNLVYVDDVVTALQLAATHDTAIGERFLISGPEHPTWAQFIGAFELMLGVQRTVPLSVDAALRLWRRSQRRPWLLSAALRALRNDPRLHRRLLATREGMAAQSLIRRVRPRPAASAVRPAGQPASDDPLPVGPIRPWVIENMACRARVTNVKAHRLLGYTPLFTLRQGMDLTEQWARWAGLIP